MCLSFYMEGKFSLLHTIIDYMNMKVFGILTMLCILIPLPVYSIMVFICTDSVQIEVSLTYCV